MILVPLTQGLFAKVSREDYDKVVGYNWSAAGDRNGKYYAMRTEIRSGVRRTVRMHRLVAGAQHGQIVDHINGDTLDNTRANLRLCNALENSRNRKVRSDNQTGIKGVFVLRNRRFQARITVHGTEISLGVFTTTREAAMAYNSAALKTFGEFAKLNDITL